MVENLESPIEALKAAVAVAGSQSAFARYLGVTQRAVWRWLNEGKHLPAHHVLTAEEATGVSRFRLRPDIYRRESMPAERRDDSDQLEPAA